MMQVDHISVGNRLLPLSFHAQAGEVVHVIGPNGSGKSTLLAAMSGLLSARDGMQGQVRLVQHQLLTLPIHEQVNLRAYLCQQARPAFNLDVFQFLALSLPSAVDPQATITQEVVAHLVGLLQLTDKLHRKIQTLSGGEWQRVRLAGICLQIWRALNPHSELLILDEPAAALDVAQEGMLYQLVDEVAKQGITVLIANHDLNRTLRHADKVLLLKQGVMQAYGTADEVMTAAQLSAVFDTPIRRVEFEQRLHLLLG